MAMCLIFGMACLLFQWVRVGSPVRKKHFSTYHVSQSAASVTDEDVQWMLTWFTVHPACCYAVARVVRHGSRSIFGQCGCGSCVPFLGGGDNRRTLPDFFPPIFPKFHLFPSLPCCYSFCCNYFIRTILLFI